MIRFILQNMIDQTASYEDKLNPFTPWDAWKNRILRWLS